MNRNARTTQAMIVASLFVAAFIGSADATTPQSSTPMIKSDKLSSAVVPVTPDVADEKPATAAKKVSSLLPVRDEHSGVRADLFAGHSWYTPPPAPPVRERPAPVERAPTAPPLPFSYIGQYEQDGIATLFYLVKDDRVYDVRIGDVIDDTYSVDKLSNGQLMFTYLPLNSSQGLRLGDQQ